MSRGSGTGKSYAKLIVTSLLLIGVGTLIIMLGFHMGQSGTMTSTTTAQKMNRAQTEWENEMKERLVRMEAEILQHREVETLEKAIVVEEKSEKVEECDIVIVGAGTSGLVSAYRLAPSLGTKLCLFDERERIGGKSQSDLLRGGDVILRCLAHEMASLIVTHGSLGSFQQPVFLDTPPIRQISVCSDGICQNPFVSESVYAPNGLNSTLPYGNILDPCHPGQNWTTCSFLSEYQKLLMRPGSHPSLKNESFGQYMMRVLGKNGTAYFKDLWGMGEMERYDARWMIDFLQKDSARSSGHLREFHHGPLKSLWSRVIARIQEKGSRLFLQSRVMSVQRIANRRYELSIHDSSQKVHAKRIILATPFGHLQEMKGDVMESLRKSRFYEGVGSFGKCRWNAFFREKWWISLPDFQCNTPKCVTLENGRLGYFLTGSPTVSGLDRVQYRATPEGMEENLLVYEWEGESCEELNRIHRESGLIGLKREVMERTKVLLRQPNLNDPLRSDFSYEPFTTPGKKPGADFTTQDLEKWAQQPLPEESLCIATGSVVLDHSGWMEAGAIAAHNCLRGPVFLRSDIDSLERCTNHGKVLQRDEKSGRDNCLLLRGEYHQRDLANLSYCGGANQFPYDGPFAEDKLRVPFPIPIYEESFYHGRSKFIQ